MPITDSQLQIYFKDDIKLTDNYTDNTVQMYFIFQIQKPRENIHNFQSIQRLICECHEYLRIHEFCKKTNNVFSPMMLITLLYYGLELCLFSYDITVSMLFG